MAERSGRIAVIPPEARQLFKDFLASATPQDIKETFGWEPPTPEALYNFMTKEDLE